MHIGLFVPCYIDQFYPGVAIATLQLLQKLGCRVSFPLNQTCCGQPMANSGFANLTGGCNRNFIENFSAFDYIVAPSGSCILHLKEHLRQEDAPLQQTKLADRLFELTEFLTGILAVDNIDANFPHRVGLHNCCHGQRGLHLSSMTETMLPVYSKPEKMLQMVKGINVSRPKRSDECCGFGGTFCVFEEAVSVKMGKDRIQEHESNGVEYITGTDVSCLMHLEGILKRMGSHIKTIHVAEILNGVEIEIGQGS